MKLGKGVWLAAATMAALGFAFSVSAAVPGADAYVQGGLVLQLDGIDNCLSGEAGLTGLVTGTKATLATGDIGFVDDSVQWFKPGLSVIVR